MKKDIFIDILAIVLIISLFTLVALKYIDEPKEVLLGKVGVTKVYVSGYEVEKYIDEDDIIRTYHDYELPANYKSKINQSLNYTNSVPILNYHGLTPVQDDVNSLSNKQFQEQLFALKKAGYQTITLDDLYLFMRSGKQLPPKSFMITFDDGRRDSYYFADPVLEALNYSAVMFIVAKYSLEQDSKYYLSYDELKEMQQSQRWELQSHSYSGHKTILIDNDGTRGSFFGNKMYLEDKERLENDNEYQNRITIDLLRGKYLMEERFGTQISSFAIPFSDFGQHESNYDKADEISENVYKNIYRMVFYQYKPLKDKDFKANYNDKKRDFYFIMRITVDPNTPANELLKEIDATQEISLPYTEDFENKYRWLKNWGVLDFNSKSKTIVIGNNNDSTTTLSYLDGSYLLTDYSFTIKIDKISNQTMSSVVRFENANTYTSCIIRDDVAIIEDIDELNKTFSNRVPLQENFKSLDNYELRVDVSGNKISCYMNDELVNEAVIETMHSHGGVGIRTSLNDKNEVGETIISSISINKIGN